MRLVCGEARPASRACVIHGPISNARADSGLRGRGRLHTLCSPRAPPPPPPPASPLRAPLHVPCARECDFQLARRTARGTAQRPPTFSLAFSTSSICARRSRLPMAAGGAGMGVPAVPSGPRHGPRRARPRRRAPLRAPPRRAARLAPSSPLCAPFRSVPVRSSEAVPLHRHRAAPRRASSSPAR